MSNDNNDNDNDNNDNDDDDDDTCSRGGQAVDDEWRMNLLSKRSGNCAATSFETKK